MSNSKKQVNIRSGQGPGDVTSGYNSGDEEEKSGLIAARERRKKEEAAREKLKEELLRQFEAGQLQVEGNLPSQEVELSPTEPRLIPTIEEQRDKMATSIRRIAPSSVRPSVPLPDLSRPPPGFSRPRVQAVTVPIYQPQPLYNYEDTIVSRVLQSLIGSRIPQAEPPDGQPQGVVEKVLNWDVGTGQGRGKKNLAYRSREEPRRSLSTERRGRSSQSREKSPRWKSRRRRSLSVVSVRVIRPADNSKYDRYNSLRRSRSKNRSRSRSRHKNNKRSGERCERDKSVERLNHRSSRHQSRVLSPLTRKCSSRTPERSKSGHGTRRYDCRRRSSSKPRVSSPVKSRARSRSRYSPRLNSPRARANNSPKTRKIVLLSPIRVKKSVREIINEEKDRKRPRESRRGSSSPVKKRVKDRLGVRKVNPEEIEVYNMDPRVGKCGAVAVVKEYIDSKNGIMELRTPEGGSTAVILFSAGQIWVPDRKRDPNGPPKRYDSASSQSLHTLFPVGQEVLINARKVDSVILDMQATAVWPKFTEIPEYEIQINLLDEELRKINEICSVEKLVPICINGLAPVGSLNIWSAKVRKIIDNEWGVVEIKSVPRDGKREFSFRFFCFFHKHDVWVEEGVRVGDNRFFKEKPLGEIVELSQPVDIVTRSIIREKGLAMRKAFGSNVEMQAICVSLRPDCIPDGAPKGTRVEGGPGAFGGTSRGETPYMFKKGYKHQLNVKLAKYLQASGKACQNIDPSLVIKLESSETTESIMKPSDVTQNFEKRVVYKLTEDPSPKESSPKSKQGVTVDSQNNVVEARHARPAVKLYDKLSNSTARVREYISESVGLLENLTKDWVCLFQTADCVLTEGSMPLQLYPVGTKVQINANLVECSLPIQYIASCVWIKTENALILPNNVDTQMIPASKKAVYDELNFKLSHLDMKTGIVFQILDDNFGVIKHNSRMVLFDTCDFWTSDQGTAAQLNKSLKSLMSVGDTVMFHAAWIQSPNLTGIPYLATAVWLLKHSPFSAGNHPVALRRDKIHPDKIKIYEMVSRCSALQEALAFTEKEEKTLKSTKAIGPCKIKVYDQKGVVKVAFKIKGSNVLIAAILEFDKINHAFYLPSVSVESHEKVKICIPGTKVCFSAIPVGSSEDYPVSHIATAVSHIHHKMPLNKDVDKIVEISKDSLRMIMEKKPDLSRSMLQAQMAQIFKIEPSKSSMAKDISVIDCFPTGRLVCMFDDKCGILEDHRRELAFFEKADLNLSSDLKLRDIVMIMTRCRDVTIRFQASYVLDGPVKMVVHDGTVSISSNIVRYFPDVQVKKSRIMLKPKSFSFEKESRAVAAVEQFKADKILTPDYIIDSGKYKGTLGKVNKYSNSSSDTIKENKRLEESERQEVVSLVKQNGKVFAILNDSFGLLQFSQDEVKQSYCLFDTFDLYLEGGKSAAQSNKSVADIVELDMSVYFHACQILPDCPVSWLATGVWIHEKVNQPKPVAFRKITKEKLHVFKKVAETCKVLVMEDESEATDDLDQENKSDCKTVDSSQTNEERIDSSTINEVASSQHGSIHSKNISEKEENQLLGSSSLPRHPSESFVKEDMSTTSNIKTEDDARLGENQIKETEVLSNSVSKACGLEESFSDSSENNIKETEGISSSVNKECGLEKPVFESSSTSPTPVLPEYLCAKSTSGSLVGELDEKMAIFSLDGPCGAKVLLHWNRMWSSKEVGEISKWEDTTGKKFKISARRLEGYEEFEYQAIYAYLAPDEKTSESSHELELDVFSKKQEDIEMLDKDLQLFQYLSRINSLATNC